MVTLAFKEAPIHKVFAEIRKQTGYTFAYAEADLARAKLVNINVNNIRMLDALAMIFADQPFSFTVIERVITIKLRTEKKINQEQSPPLAFRVGVDITGRILNEREDPVVGVSVLVKGTKIGTATDGEGEFELKKVEPDAILILSGVNIERMEVQVAGRRNLELQVKGKTGKLDEVQVIAYGKTSQRFNVGNVTTVKAEDIEKQPVMNPLLALQGRVPGLLVTQQTGLNGGAVKVRVQGENSIRNGNNPLIIIDGVPYPVDLPYTGFSETLIGNGGLGSPLSFINMNDIESIDVLKDADATSIYGSRAANGAILITTKKGRPGKMRVNINLQQGWSKVGHRMEMMNTRQYLDMRYEAMRNGGRIPANTASKPAPFLYAPDLTIWDTSSYTDWQKELIGESALFSSFNASISGGVPTASYMVGFTYNRSTDVFPGSHALQGGALHYNLNAASFNQKLKVQLTGTYNINENSLPGIDLTAAAIRLVPVAPPLFSTDSINWAPNPVTGVDTWDNPLGDTYYRRYKSNARTFYSSLFLSYNILPGLEFKGNLGYNAIQSQSSMASPLAAVRPALRPNSTRTAAFNTSLLHTVIVEPQLSYYRDRGKIKLDALLGATIQQNNMDVLNVDGSGYTSDFLLEGIAGAGSVTATTGRSNYKYNALFIRLGAVWDNRFLVSLNARRDGSSRFGDKRRFHNFGSAGLGWIFSESKLIKEATPWLSFGKLRVSYGTTGSDQIGDYSYLSNNGPVIAEILYQGAAAMQVNSLFNPYLQWEETRKLQGGIDLGLWKDRVLLNITYAYNRSSNQLVAYILPSVTGFSSINMNFPATVQNTSWEFMLNTVNLKTPRFKWTSAVNLTIPSSKVAAFPGIEQSPYADGTNGIIVGEPKGVLKLYSYQGLDPLTGSYLMKDGEDGNPTIAPSGDPHLLLSAVTEYYGGLQNTITIGNVQIDFLLQGVRQKGRNEFDYWNGEFGPGYFERGRGNQPVTVLDRWQKPGDKGKVAPYSADPSYKYTLGPYPLNISDGYYSHNASYIRLKNLSLSWQVPAAWLKKLGLQAGRIYSQGQNLLTFTQYSGLDPETQSVASLPPLRTWTVGIQVGW